MPRNQRSAEAAKYRAWYKTSHWQRIRTHQLSIEPMCRMCAAEGITRLARVCDHIVPHRGDWNAFLGGPFQSLCDEHHSGAKQSEERLGYVQQIGTDGWPIDPKHPTHK